MTIREILDRIEYTVIIDGEEKPGSCITFSTWMENMIKQSEQISGYTPSEMFDPVARDNFQKCFAVAYYARWRGFAGVVADYERFKEKVDNKGFSSVAACMSAYNDILKRLEGGKENAD